MKIQAPLPSSSTSLRFSRKREREARGARGARGVGELIVCGSKFSCAGS